MTTPSLREHPHGMRWTFPEREAMREYGEACAAAERAACIAICDLEAIKALEGGDLEAYYGTSAYAISNAIKARGTTC